MKQAKLNQIAEMKNQTFGVEVEMNNITRRKAAKVASEYFGTSRTAYEGGVYDTHIAVDASGRNWKFSSDASISGSYEQKCEMVTPVLRYDDMELLQGLIRELRKAGAKSSPSRGCGVHIHIGGDDHTPKSILNLVNMMARHEKELAKMIKIAESRFSYCDFVSRSFLKEVNAKKPTTKSELADIWYQSQGCDYGRTQHYNSSRYHMLNLHAWFNRYHTVEFRMFQFDEPSEGREGGLHAGQLKAMIQLCLAMSQLAKQASYIRVTPKKDLDDETSMKKWFYELAMIGNEFETARDYFTRNANGEVVRVEKVFDSNSERNRIARDYYGGY